MPGIAGRIGPQTNRQSGEMVHDMIKCMIHAPFHKAGFYQNELLNLSVGWVSDTGSFSERLPIWNETRQLCLIFIGEDFRDSKEITDLKASGHAFNLNDASYLIHLYEQAPEKFFQRLNGWFSGVLIDLAAKMVFLFNDRYSFRRIHYYEDASGFYFASEAKSLLQVLPHLREIDFKSLGEYFSCGCVLQNRTLFKGISILPGASAWTFQPDQKPARNTYFQKSEWETRGTLSSSSFSEALRNEFATSMPRYLAARSPLAMSLTGGLDGRLIMAWANASPGTLPCYTFGGPFRDNSDVISARRVAESCGQKHSVIPVGDEFLRQFPALAERSVYISDGMMDVTGAVELYVNQIAREIAPNRLTGNYGSEILRGSVAFRPRLFDKTLLDPTFDREVAAASETYELEARGSRLSFIAFKQVPWYHQARASIEQSQLTVRSPYLDNALVALMYQAPAEPVRPAESWLDLVASGRRDLGRIPTDRGLVCNPVPALYYFQRLLPEFTFKAEYAYDIGMPQWLSKIDRLLAPIKPERLFLGHHKFYHFRVWYRDRLGPYLQDVLLDPRSRSRSYLQGKTIEKLLHLHLSSRANHTFELHRILTTELIYRQLIDKEGTSNRFSPAPIPRFEDRGVSGERVLCT